MPKTVGIACMTPADDTAMRPGKLISPSNVLGLDGLPNSGTIMATGIQIGFMLHWSTTLSDSARPLRDLQVQVMKSPGLPSPPTTDRSHFAISKKDY